MRKGGFRSSRLYYPIVLNPVMTKNTMLYKVVNGKSIEVEEGQPYTYAITASASMSDGADWAPYKAFRQTRDSYGWRTPNGFMVGEWIQIDLPPWYRRPDNPDPTQSGSNPPAVTSVEIWTPAYEDNIPNKFKILGSYDGVSWDDIRECEIKKREVNKRFTFPLGYKNGDTEITFDQYPRYRYFRLEITKTFPDEQYAGFAQIDLRAHIDNHNPYFPHGNSGDIPYFGVTERMFMQNDDNDGIIWEKVHKIPNIIFSTVSWYPGYYASTSFATTMFRPRDPIRPYIGKSHGIYSRDVVQRTKDFLVAITGSYYYSSRGIISVSKDGVHWTKAYTETQAYTWMSSGYGWSTKRNVGIMSGYRVEIDDSGKFSAHKIPESSETGHAVIGDVITDGSTGYVYSAPVQYVKMINADGEKYTSAVHSNYSYIDLSKSEGQQVIWAPTNWNYVYLNGEYFAYGKFAEIRYYNEVKHEWQTMYHFTILKSTDGFKHVTSYSIADPVVGESFNEVTMYYFNGHYLLFERGRIKDASTDQWVPHTRVYDFGTSFNGSFTMKDTLDYITVPLIGYNADPAYDSTSMVFKGDGPSGDRIRKIGASFSDLARSTVYIKDGKPAEPYESLVFKTTYKKNGWSSNSWDEGGFVFIQYPYDKSYVTPFTAKGGKNSLSYGTSNAVIDRDDGTWGLRGK